MVIKKVGRLQVKGFGFHVKKEHHVFEWRLLGSNLFCRGMSGNATEKENYVDNMASRKVAPATQNMPLP